jgi:hypothetical protein
VNEEADLAVGEAAFGQGDMNKLAALQLVDKPGRGEKADAEPSRIACFIKIRELDLSRAVNCAPLRMNSVSEAASSSQGSLSITTGWEAHWVSVRREAWASG